MSKVAMISIIDDDLLVRESTADLISSLGHEALIFGSGEQFLASGRLKDTACIITDLHMPGLNGLDLQSHLLAEGHRTPIIFITAYPKDAAFPSGEKGGRLLCSAFAFPRLNCSRREVLKLVSPHTQLLATRGKTGADGSPHAQSHRKTAIPATMQMRIRLGGV